MQNYQERIDAFNNHKTDATIFIGSDPYGIYNPSPQCAMELVTDGNVYSRYYEFIIRSVENALSGTFVPDARLQFYHFWNLSELPLISRMSWHLYGPKKLIPWCEERGLLPMHTVNLRDAVYAIQEGMSLSDLIHGNIDLVKNEPYRKFIDYQNSREKLYKCNTLFQSPYSVVQTSKGVLIFSAGEIGERGLKAFYQKLADDYFNPGMGFEKIIVGELGSITPVIAPHVDKCCVPTANRLAMVYSFSDEVYTPVGKLQVMMDNLFAVGEFRLNPVLGDFNGLLQFSGAQMSKRNDDICRLLYIKQTGYYNINSVPFTYSSDFRALGEQFQKLSEAKSVPEFDKTKFEDLSRQAIEKADKILMDADVRGYRSLRNLLSDDNDIPLENIKLGSPHKNVLLRGDTLYLPEINHKNLQPVYATADFTNNKILLSPMPLTDRTVMIKGGRECGIDRHTQVKQPKIRNNSSVKKKM